MNVFLWAEKLEEQRLKIKTVTILRFPHSGEQNPSKCPTKDVKRIINVGSVNRRIITVLFVFGADPLAACTCAVLKCGFGVQTANFTRISFFFSHLKCFKKELTRYLRLSFGVCVSIIALCMDLV